MNEKLFPVPFGLYLVITNPVVGYARCAEAAVRAGISFVQLRMKHATREEIVKEGLAMRKVTAGTKTRLIVNDDPSIAVEVGADGVHLGQSDMPIQEARAKFPELKIFGMSTHNFAQAKAAEALHPDYIGVGPIYATPTKEIPDPTVGVEEAGRIIASVKVPALAIGGVNKENLPLLRAVGVQNYAVVRAVCQSEDPYSRILELM